MIWIIPRCKQINYKYDEIQQERLLSRIYFTLSVERVTAISADVIVTVIYAVLHFNGPVNDQMTEMAADGPKCHGFLIHSAISMISDAFSTKIDWNVCWVSLITKVKTKRPCIRAKQYVTSSCFAVVRNRTAWQRNLSLLVSTYHPRTDGDSIEGSALFRVPKSKNSYGTKQTLT